MLITCLASLLCIVVLFIGSSGFSSDFGENISSPLSEKDILQPSGALETVTVLPEVMVNNVVDGEDRKVTKAPVILLRRGQTYRVEQRYTGGGAERAAFDKWEVSRGKGFWSGQTFLDWSHRSEGNQGAGVLSASDFPSGKCLITFWAFDEDVPLHKESDGSRHREVPFIKWTKSPRGNPTVFTFEYKDAYTTATVTLYRLL